MKYIKAKYKNSNRGYTFKTSDDVVAGDIVTTSDGKKLEVMEDKVDLEWVEIYGADKVNEVKKFIESEALNES